MSDPSQVPHIKKDALVSVVLTSGSISDLQGVLVYLLDGKSQEQVQAISDKITAKEPLDRWESSCLIMTRLMRIILESAEEHHMVEYKGLEDTLQQAIQ